MYEETLRKFRAQFEMLSRDDVEKMAKRLDKEELITFIDVMDLQLRQRLVWANSIVQQELKNLEILLKSVWSVISERAQRILWAERFDLLNSLRCIKDCVFPTAAIHEI